MKCEVAVMIKFVLDHFLMDVCWMKCGDWELHKSSIEEYGKERDLHESSIDEPVAAPSVVSCPCSMTCEALAWIEPVQAVSDMYRFEPFTIDVLKYGILFEALALLLDTKQSQMIPTVL